MAARLLRIILISNLFLGCKESLVHNVTEIEAHKILAKLQKIDLNAEKELQSDGRWSVIIPTDSFNKAVSYLDSERTLWRDRSKKDESPSIFLSREEQQFRLERQMGEGVEETLLSLKGVLEAKVHITRPYRISQIDENTLGKESGSAILIVTEDFGFSREDIQSLIGGATGINPTSVSVIISKEQTRDRKYEDTKLTTKNEIFTAKDLFNANILTYFLGAITLLVPIIIFIKKLKRKRYLRSINNVEF